MNDIAMLETIYDILAQNEVSQAARDEVLRRIDHINYDDKSIVFDNDSNEPFVLWKGTI